MGETQTEPPIVQEAAPTPSLDVTPFLGVWHNTNAGSAGIACVRLTGRDDALFVRVFGAGAAEPVDWQETMATTFADAPDGREAKTFVASYRFAFMETQLHAWIKLGVLVVSKFDRFVDQSGRANRFSREFFYKVSD